MYIYIYICTYDCYIYIIYSNQASLLSEKTNGSGRQIIWILRLAIEIGVCSLIISSVAKSFSKPPSSYCMCWKFSLCLPVLKHFHTAVLYYICFTVTWGVFWEETQWSCIYRHRALYEEAWLLYTAKVSWSWLSLLKLLWAMLHSQMPPVSERRWEEL